MGDTIPGSTGQTAGVIPDYCLIRMFDFTIEPGKTYEYRIKVRMANPNYERKDVASQGIAADPELTPKDWYVLPEAPDGKEPKKLVVPSDLYFYAVDQAKLDKEKKTELKLQPVAAGTQTVLQIQKWVDYLQLKNRTELPVGDWVIAERVVATHGEPIGRQRVEVPYWRRAQDRYTMATDQPPPRNGDRKHVDTVEVSFVPEGKEPILVDFLKTGSAYTRKHPKTDDAAPRPTSRFRSRTRRRRRRCCCTPPTASCCPTTPRRTRSIPSASSTWMTCVNGLRRSRTRRAARTISCSWTAPTFRGLRESRYLFIFFFFFFF